MALPSSARVAACLLLWLWAVPALAQEKPAPAVIEFLLPPGAKATADGKDFTDRQVLTLSDLKADEIRRVKVAVKFADGASDERLVDVSPGVRVPVPVPQPSPEKVAVIGTRMLTPINSADVSRDGRFIAVGLDDGAVVLWDTAVGRPVRTLAGHQKAVLAVAFTRDGKRLVSGSADTTAILWDVESGKPLRTDRGHTGSVVSVAVSPDGSQFLTGSPDGSAILRNIETGETVLKLPWKRIQGVAFSPDGKTLATASLDFTATLWDAKTGQQLFVLRGHREDVNCVAFSPDSRRVVTGSSEDIGIVWDAATGKNITRTARHSTNVHSAAFVPDGRRIITGEREQLVIMCDAANGSPVRTFAGHSAEVLSIIPAPDGRTALTASRDGTARLWDLATGRELVVLTTDSARKSWAAVSPDGLFDASESGRRALGYSFTKSPGGEIDQFAAGRFRPGLLAEVWRGDRPYPPKPLGLSKPPLVKIVPPKGRTFDIPTVPLAVDVTDQGGGVSGLVIENNGVRLSVPVKAGTSTGGKASRYTFDVPLAPGSNKLRVRAATADGSREIASSEVDLSSPLMPGRLGRLYVVAVGIGTYAEKGLDLRYPAKDAVALGDVIRQRAGSFYERIDVVPVLDRDATAVGISDTIEDVAELTRPQDTVMVVLCGQGALVGDKVFVGPHDLRIGKDRPEEALKARGVNVEELATALGTAKALKRVLIVDAAASGSAFAGVLKGRSESALRVIVERLARTHGVIGAVAVPATERAGESAELGRGLLASALLVSAGEEPTKAPPADTATLDVTEWLQYAADQAGSLARKHFGESQDVQASSQAKGFLFLVKKK